MFLFRLGLAEAVKGFKAEYWLSTNISRIIGMKDWETRLESLGDHRKNALTRRAHEKEKE